MAIITTASTTPIFGNNFINSFHYIGPDGSIVPTNIVNTAIMVSGESLITVDGTLLGYSAIEFIDGIVTPNGADFVHVRQTGLVFGPWLAGVGFIDDGSQLINAGQISGNSGVNFNDADNVSVANSGTITGIFNPVIGQNGIAAPGTGLAFFESSGFSVANSGRIEGQTGISIADSTGQIDNSGIILGAGSTGYAIVFDSFNLPNAVLRMVNSGEIRSAGFAIYLLNGALDLTNTGLLVGNVTLGGSGNDRILGNSGTILGIIDTGFGNDRVQSGLGDDVVLGNAGNDIIAGGAGDDRLSGDLGFDRLLGGAGDDTLLGGGGGFSDTLIGGLGDDVMTGGAGADILVFRRGQGNDTVTDFTTGDLIDVQTMGFTSFTQLAALARDTIPGLLIDLTGRGGGTILLEGFLKSALDATDVLI